MEKRWPGLKDCEYNVGWYSRKRFYDFLPRFELELLWLSEICKKIKELKDEIESYERKYTEPALISISKRKIDPTSYFKELIECEAGFGVFVDLYDTLECADKDAETLNRLGYLYGFESKYFFVISNLDDIGINDKLGAAFYLKKIKYLSSNISGIHSENESNPFYVVASCPLSYCSIIKIPNKSEKVRALEKRLEELKVNKLMDDNGFDENGRLKMQ